MSHWDYRNAPTPLPSEHKEPSTYIVQRGSAGGVDRGNSTGVHFAMKSVGTWDLIAMQEMKVIENGLDQQPTFPLT